MRTTVCCDVQKDDIGHHYQASGKSRNPSRKKRDFRVSLRIRTRPGSFKDLTSPTLCSKTWVKETFETTGAPKRLAEVKYRKCPKFLFGFLGGDHLSG